MTTARQHDHKADQNEQVADLVAHNGFHDWSIVCFFYAALHRVESYFWRNYEGHFHDHQQRNDAVANEGQLAKAAGFYRVLYKQAHDARYRAEMTFTSNELALVRLAYDNFKKALP
jgi:hypothetical protein